MAASFRMRRNGAIFPLFALPEAMNPMPLKSTLAHG